jgi:cell division protein ZipA
LFVVESSSSPGYFLPEQIAAGRQHFHDLIFGFSIPRSIAPAKIFDGMAKAVEYCQKRLGGTILNEDGNKANLPALKKRIAEVERELRAAGFEPGLDETLQLF